MLLRSGRVYLQRADPASWQVHLEMPCQIPSSRCERVQLLHLRNCRDTHVGGAVGTVSPCHGFNRLLQGFSSGYLRWVGSKYPQVSVGLHPPDNADLTQDHRRNLYFKQLAHS